MVSSTPPSFDLCTYHKVTLPLSPPKLQAWVHKQKLAIGIASLCQIKCGYCLLSLAQRQVIIVYHSFLLTQNSHLAYSIRSHNWGWILSGMSTVRRGSRFQCTNSTLDIPNLLIYSLSLLGLKKQKQFSISRVNCIYSERQCRRRNHGFTSSCKNMPPTNWSVH